MNGSDSKAIRQVIERAYINGIHGNQEPGEVKSGFHPEFIMMVKNGHGLNRVTIDEWLSRLEIMKRENHELWASKTRHEFLSIDITGDAAMAKLDVYKGEVHFSTDYMLLYRFENGWRIVSKVFTVPA